MVCDEIGVHLQVPAGLRRCYITTVGDPYRVVEHAVLKKVQIFDDLAVGMRGNGDLVPVGAGRAGVARRDGPRGARANRSDRVDTAFPLSTTLCLSRGALVS